MRNKPSFLLAGIIILLLTACTPKEAATGTVVLSATRTTGPVQVDTQPLPSATQLPLTFTPTTQPTEPIAASSATITPTTAPEEEHRVQIAYIKHGDVALWTEGIGVAYLTDMHDVVKVKISPDGSLVAFQRQDVEDPSLQELWVVNTSGIPEPRVLVSYDDLQEITPADPDKYFLGAVPLNFSWRPGTHDLAYSTYIMLIGVGSALNHDVRLVNADTLEKTTIFDKGEGGNYYFSPDGNQLALSNPESISLANADGSDLRRDVLTYPEVITYSEYQYHPHPIWASDANSLRVAIPPHDGMADPTQLTGLWLIPVDGSPAVLLGEINAISYAWPNNAFAPDLQHVIYVEEIGDPTMNQRALHIANPDVSNDVIYDSNQSIEFTGWSPDSRHFIYTLYHDDKKEFYVGQFDDQPVLINPDPGSIRDIQWIDGSRFAYLIRSGNLWELRISDLAGEILTVIDTIPDSSPVIDVKP